MNETYRWHPELDAVTRIVFPYWDDIQNVRHLIIPFLDGSRDAAKCRLYRAKSFNNGNPTVTLFDFDTDNGFIQDLLMEYQETRRGVQPGVYQLDFFRNFSQSLDIVILLDYRLQILYTEKWKGWDNDGIQRGFKNEGR